MVVLAERFLCVRVERLGGGGPSSAASAPSVAELTRAVHHAVAALAGDDALAAFRHRLHLKHYSRAAAHFVLRLPRKHATLVRAALTTVRTLAGEPVRLTVAHVAGSQRTLRRVLLAQLARRHASTLREMRAAVVTIEQPGVKAAIARAASAECERLRAEARELELSAEETARDVAEATRTVGFDGEAPPMAAHRWGRRLATFEQSGR